MRLVGSTPRTWRRSHDQLAERRKCEVRNTTLTPEDAQEKVATEIEISLREQSRIAAQLADPKETDLDYLLEEADREIVAGQVGDLDELACSHMVE